MRAPYSDPTRLKFLSLFAHGPQVPNHRLFRDSFILKLYGLFEEPAGMRIAANPGRRVGGFLAYGRVTTLTIVDGSAPAAQKWLPGVVSATLNIRVRSTTATAL